MQREMITHDNINKYLSLLLMEEFFGIQSGRLYCFGAYDERNGTVQGLITAQICDDDIHIRRIYTVPEYRRQGIGSGLLQLITGLSVSAAFIVFVHGIEASPEFLLHRGFEEANSAYSYTYARPCDVRPSVFTDHHETGYKIRLLPDVNDREVGDYIFSGAYDRLLQFPEGFFDRERFSEGSIIVQKDHQIVAAVLLEETEGCTQISYMSGREPVALKKAFSTAIRCYESEYGKEADFRFLVCRERYQQIAEGLFESYHKEPIRIFRRNGA